MKSNSVWGTVIPYVGIHCYMSEYIVECQNTLLHVYVRIHWSDCSVHQRTHVVRRQKFYFSGFNSVQTYSVLFKEFMQIY